MNIQLTQILKNNMYKDDMYVTISNDSEIENLLYLKFYNNINGITVELLQTARKAVIRKILLIEHIDKIIYRTSEGIKEEINTNRKLIVKINEKEDKDLISDECIIKFQKILDISKNIAVVQNLNLLNEELLNVLERNNTEHIRIMNFGKNKYTLQQIRNIRDRVKEYITLAKQKNTKIEKFMELYRILCDKIRIDNLEVSDGNICDIIYGKTTMNGYSEILKYILDEINIENKIIDGKLSNGQFHCWNQVKLDYIWYNADLALDATNYRNLNIKGFRYCLKNDEEFYEDHIALSQNIEICNQTSSYIFIKEIERKENFMIKLMKKISKLVKGKSKLKGLNSGT